MQIRQGTVNVTNGSAHVDAYDPLTDWSTVKNTDWFIVDGDDVFYSIAQVQIPGPNQTPRLVLTANYGGVTGTQVPYAIIQDFTPSQNIPLINRGDIETGAIYSRAMMILDVSYGGELDTLRADMTTLQNDMSTLQGQMSALQAGTVPTSRKVSTIDSIAGGGDLSADRTFQLVGDVASGTLLSYGFDANGNRGFYPSPPAPAYVQKAGDTMTGALLHNVDGALYLQAKTKAQGAGVMFSTLGSTNAADKGKEAIYLYKPQTTTATYDQLYLVKYDPTGATSWSGYVLDSYHKVGAGDMVAGAAAANLGYVPINSNGGYYTPASPVIFYGDYGLGGISYSIAPLRLQAITTNGRPQIGFYMPGYAASLFYNTDNRFWWIDAAGQTYAIADSVHKIDNNWLLAGTAVANLGYTPVNKAGDYLQSGQFFFIQDQGLGSASWAQAMVRIRRATAGVSAGGRAGISFENTGVNAVYLYLEHNGKLRFIDGGGTVHEITSVP